MLGFDLTLWDYLTFLVLFLGVVAFLVVVVFVLGLPGRIAIARRHPEADAVNIMGWVGFVAIVPWIQAFIWAFKPTNVVDIRYFPKQEHQDTDQIIAKLTGKPTSNKAGPLKAANGAGTQTGAQD
jgi:uncharacterized membrane protein